MYILCFFERGGGRSLFSDEFFKFIPVFLCELESRNTGVVRVRMGVSEREILMGGSRNLGLGEHNLGLNQQEPAWASAAGRPCPPWIFIHGIDIVDKGLMVIFSFFFSFAIFRSFFSLAPLKEA